jgi:competence protein ComEC
MPLNALAFVFGVWVLQQQPALPSPPALWAAAALAFAVMGLPRVLGWRSLRSHGWLAINPNSWSRPLCTALACCLLGIAWAGQMAQWRLADALDPAAEARDLKITGVLATLPEAFDRGLRFEFDVEGSELAGGQPAPPGGGTSLAPSHIALTWYGGYGADVEPPPDMHAGERWSFTVRLKRPHANANPYVFDSEAWMLESGIRAVGYVRPGPAVRLDAMVWRPGYAIERLRENLRERFWDLLPDHPYASVMIALALGDQNAISRDDWTLFAHTGVSHLMSISGLHITMLAGLAAALAFAIWRRVPALTLRLPARKAAALVGAMAALAYCLLAGFQVPAQRTLYMLAVVAVAPWFDRIGRGGRVLGLALFAVTLLDPWAVLAAGFWLSFGAVAIIFFISQGRLRPGSALVEWGRVQWAITVGLTPLLLGLFQQVSIVSPIANAVAIPVVSFIVAPLSLAGIVMPFAWPLELGHWVLEWLMRFLHLLDTLPYAVWHQHAPLPWTLPLAVAGIAWLLLPAGFPARYLGAALLLPMFMLEPPKPGPGAARITVIDVGQGLAVLVETREHVLLYDTGPQYGPEADAGSRVVVPVLRGGGIDRIDTMIVSHNDSDHSGGALSVLDAMPVGLVLSSLAVTNPIHDRAALHERCLAGQAWTWDAVEFSILNPTAGDYAPRTKVNNLSCVLRVRTAHAAALFTGDIEKGAEQAMLIRDAPLRADLLIAPHHGSHTSSTPGFIAAVAPAATVFTLGYLNRFGHPRPDVVARYREAGSQVVRTDSAGAVTITLDDEGMRLEGYRSTHARYWQGR